MACRPSYAQLEKLIEFMENNPQLVNGRMRCSIGRHQNKLKWEELTRTLNSMEGLKKDTKQWSRFWADKKYGLKRRAIAQRNAAEYRRRYGLDNDPPPLSDLDDRILLLVGGKETQGIKLKNMPAPISTEETVEQPKASTPRAVSSKSSQTTILQRSPRISATRLRSQVSIERQRLIKIEEKRVATEAAQARGWCKTTEALNQLAKAVVTCGQTIAEALNNSR